MEEVEFRLNSKAEEYPTKVVITHDLIDANIYSEKEENEKGIRSGEWIEGREALKITLIIKDKGYSKKDIKNKLIKISNKLIAMFD